MFHVGVFVISRAFVDVVSQLRVVYKCNAFQSGSFHSVKDNRAINEHKMFPEYYLTLMNMM